jgi:hypothetical protein
MLITRSIVEPLRKYVDMNHRWRGPDKGLIWCWERGRQMAEADPALAARAANGELMILGWKGGVEPGVKMKTKTGCHSYLAQWQGLSGKDLDIDTSNPTTLTCALSDVAITYTGDPADWS